MARLSISTKKIIAEESFRRKEEKIQKKVYGCVKFTKKEKKEGEFHLLIKDMVLYDHFLFSNIFV